MNIDDLVTKFKIQKLGNPICANPVLDIKLELVQNILDQIKSKHNLEDEIYATKENVFYNTRRIVARNSYNKKQTQLFSNLDFDDDLVKIIDPLCIEIKKILPNSVPVLIQVATILPSQSLKWHIDVFLYQQFTNKLHIPLTTNNDSFFDVFENGSVKRINMTVGQIYNINNLALHRSINNGGTSRSHLIIDFMDKGILDSLLETDINFFHTKLDYMSQIEEKELKLLYEKYKK